MITFEIRNLHAKDYPDYGVYCTGCGKHLIEHLFIGQTPCPKREIWIIYNDEPYCVECAIIEMTADIKTLQVHVEDLVFER